MCAGELHDDAAAPEPLDRLAVKDVGTLAVGEQRARPGQNAKGPIRPGGTGAFLELPKRDGGLLFGAASGASLDQLDQRPTEKAQIVVLTGPPGAAERGLVAAETIVQHGGEVLHHADGPPLALSGRVSGAGLDQLHEPGLLAAPGGQDQRGISERSIAGRRRDPISLIDQRRGRGELSGVDMYGGTVF